MCVFLWFILSFFLIVCLSVTVNWVAVKTASEMTYTVSARASNSAQSSPVSPFNVCIWTGFFIAVLLVLLIPIAHTSVCISGCPECPCLSVCLSVCFSKCVGCHWSWVKRPFNPLVLWCCLLGERKAIVSVQRHFSRLSVISLSAYRPAGVTTCCSDCISHITHMFASCVVVFYM